MGFRTRRGTFLCRLVILAASFFRYRAVKQTDTHANGGKNITPATVVGVGNKMTLYNIIIVMSTFDAVITQCST